MPLIACLGILRHLPRDAFFSPGSGSAWISFLSASYSLVPKLPSWMDDLVEPWALLGYCMMYSSLSLYLPMA